MKLKWAELIMENGKVSRTGLMFLVWMTFMMTMIGVITFKGTNLQSLPDIPEPYVYITLVLCSTYTARRFLNDKYGKNNPQPQHPTVVIQPTPPYPPATVIQPQVNQPQPGPGPTVNIQDPNQVQQVPSGQSVTIS